MGADRAAAGAYVLAWHHDLCTEVAGLLRRSTWVILAIGGAAATAVHPVDSEVNARLSGSDAAG